MQELKTDKYSFRVVSPGILELLINDNVTLDTSDAVILKEMTTKLSKNKPYSVLAKSGYFTNASPEFLRESAATNIHGLNTARAIIVNSLGHRMAGNFYLKMNRPIVETRLFSSRETALRWLREKQKKVKDQVA